MKLAYVDTSCLVAIAFGEPENQRFARRLEKQDRLFASNLAEAEYRSALSRESVGAEGDYILDWLTWIHPDRALSREFGQVLTHGFLRGADLWHLACALYLRDSLPDLRFLSADKRQFERAKRLGLA